MPSLARAVDERLAEFNARHHTAYWILGIPLAIITQILLLPLWVFIACAAVWHEHKTRTHAAQQIVRSGSWMSRPPESMPWQFVRGLFGPFTLLALFNEDGREIVVNELTRELLDDWARANLVPGDGGVSELP